MTKLSEQIDAAIAAIDATPMPSQSQLIEVFHVHREMLEQIRDFSDDIEQAIALQRGRVVPLWGSSRAGYRLYHWLLTGRRRPSAGMGACTVTSLQRSAS